MAAQVLDFDERPRLCAPQVRELDLAQTRVRTTMTRVAAIVDRTHCVDGLQAALDGEDFEQAAKYVETFLSLDGANITSILCPPDNATLGPRPVDADDTAHTSLAAVRRLELD